MAPAKLTTFLLALAIFFVSLLVLGAVVGPLVARWSLGPKGQEHPSAQVPGWGSAFDPVGDCSIEGAAKTLGIMVPGSLHDLSVERGQVGAPRVLREVEGDFLFDVTVVGHTSPQGGRTSTYGLPYHGAGLLVWLDRDNYIRFERAAILRKEALFHYLNFEQREHANLADSSGQAVPEGPISLRLERRGRRVSASYHLEGQDWVKLKKSYTVGTRGDSLKVGVVAVNTATAPFTADFRDFRLGQPVD